MRRIFVLALAALALLGVVAPDAFAQAPTPTFKINGLIDQVTTYSRNTSNYDGNLNVNDIMWYGRTRGRFDFIGEVGKAKGVLGIELDMVYGQTGSNDSTIQNSGGAALTPVQAAFGTNGGFDLNTDTRGIIEVKWLYTEFELPLIPVPTVVRLGAQPFGSAANYKLAAYATGDFPGLNVVTTITPNVKLNFTYVQVEEQLTGCPKGSVSGPPCTQANTLNTNSGGISYQQLRGDDFAFIMAPEITPLKGLDIKPMYSYFYADGTTNSNARQGRGGINTSTAFSNPASRTVSIGGTPVTVSGDYQGGIVEHRNTVGIDSRFRMGPFSLDPTALYQFGNRQVVVPAALASPSGLAAGSVAKADINAWLFDVRAGFQIGPLLLEAMYMYTTGNTAQNTTLKNVRYFQPLTTDTGYLADWGTQLSSLGIDYLNAQMESGLAIAYPGVSIGWDKYGRQQVGLKASYFLTPSLSATAGAAALMTAEKINTSGTPGNDTVSPGCVVSGTARCQVAGGGLLPNYVGAGGKGPTGDAIYMGTELHGTLTWRFAPGLSLDSGAAYMFAGDGMNALTAVNGPRSAKDVFLMTSRVRITF